MVAEAAFGMLKGRWRVLHRKCDSKKEVVRSCSLSCVVLHNICMQRGDTMPRSWDLSLSTEENQRRNRQDVRDILMMRRCASLNSRNDSASHIRNALKERLWEERTTNIVS